jgi:hypothetical protein
MSMTVAYFGRARIFCHFVIIVHPIVANMLHPHFNRHGGAPMR